MNNKIFTNGEEGKILTSVGNRIIKQPYEFGTAFKGKSPYYIDINIPNLDYDSFTILNFVKNPTGNAYFNEIFLGGVSSHSLKSQSASHYWVASSSLNVNTPAIGSVPGIGLNRFDMYYISSDKTSKTLRTGSGEVISDIPYVAGGAFDTYVLGKVLTKLRIGTYGLYTSTNILFNRLIIFNRQLSVGELKYVYGNGLGNDLQSLSGLVIDIRLQQAEVISILGVDTPCVRDFSGNNHHGQIMNLPAGTLQQKLDYANANLFVPFIQ